MRFLQVLGLACALGTPVAAQNAPTPAQQAQSVISIFQSLKGLAKLCNFPLDGDTTAAIDANTAAMLPLAGWAPTHPQQFLDGLMAEMEKTKAQFCSGTDQEEMETSFQSVTQAARTVSAGLNVTLKPLPVKSAAELIFASESEYEKLVALASRYGEATLGKDSGGDPIIKVRSKNGNWSILFYGCTKGEDCKSIQLFYGISTKNKISDAAINEWNRKKRWSKAFLDKDRDPNIAYDINMRYGATRASLNASLSQWVRLMDEFKDTISSN